jgi:hypothetical protein
MSGGLPLLPPVCFMAWIGKILVLCDITFLVTWILTCVRHVSIQNSEFRHEVMLLPTESIFDPPQITWYPYILSFGLEDMKGNFPWTSFLGSCSELEIVCGEKQELKNSRREVDSRGTKNGGRLFYFGGISFCISFFCPLNWGFALLIGPNTGLLMWCRDWKWGTFVTERVIGEWLKWFGVGESGTECWVEGE